MNGKNLIPGLSSSRPPHSEHEPQAYHALTRALGLQVWTAVNLTLVDTWNILEALNQWQYD